MEEFVAALRQDFLSMTFIAGDDLCWSPKRRVIFFRPEDNKESRWGLLHEVAHALLGHRTYKNEIDLLRKEADAWRKACELAIEYKIPISDAHIQACLDSYREWVHSHSRCPACQTQGLERGDRRYTCVSCGQVWRVNRSRFHRAYRRSENKVRGI